mmetsp:Transcript_24374/g.49912  ORF Transcript_24374/g.49912 Transcript_24374/m.49912 type:complete len:403 (+) Transcript_24374:279-1487(+)
MPPSSILALLTFTGAAAAASQFPSLDAFDAGCKKTLWVIGLSLKDGGSFLNENSSVYEENLHVALQSAHVSAPSLYPVVVLMGQLEDYSSIRVDRIKDLGAQVVFHELSFKLVLEKSCEKNNGCRARVGKGSAALATYLKVDLPLILGKLGPELVDTSAVDMSYVLWTDPDVMLFKDINSCTLPRPPLLSIGGDTGHEVASSFGVVYFNVSAYRGVYREVLDFGRSNNFYVGHGALDQAFLMNFFDWRITLLPDTFNYKPYWGSFPKGPYKPDGEITLLHFQGPKMKRALCVMSFLNALQPPLQSVRNSEVFQGLKTCGAEGPERFPGLAASLRHAFNSDKGSLYAEVSKRFERLASSEWEKDGNAVSRAAVTPTSAAAQATDPLTTVAVPPGGKYNRHVST